MVAKVTVMDGSGCSYFDGKHCWPEQTRVGGTTQWLQPLCTASPLVAKKPAIESNPA